MTAAINSTGAGKRGYPTKSSVPQTQASTQRRARERSVAIQTLLLVRKSKSDRKSGSAGMPRPSSYAVFCLKKKNRRVVLVINLRVRCTQATPGAGGACRAIHRQRG